MALAPAESFDDRINRFMAASSHLDTPGQTGFRVFLSYSHGDNRLRDRLDDHLAPLKRDSSVIAWDDREISAGQDWRKEIGIQLEKSDIIILLVSSRFLSSDFCWHVETQRALERDAIDAARVIPVILSACDWQGSPLGRLQALPSGGKPVANWGDVNKALENVVTGIRRVIAELKTLRAQPQVATRASATEHLEKLDFMDYFPVVLTSAEEHRIAVCFADIRNFAQLAHSGDARTNGSIREVLTAFFAALNYALRTAETNLHGNPEFKLGVRNCAKPQVSKALGNAAMLIWKFPRHTTNEICTGLALLIIDFVSILQRNFREAVGSLGDIGKLDLAVALSIGQALEISGWGSRGIDYVGVPVIQAIRLLDYARPFGVAVNFELAPKLFLERFCAKEGKINDFDLEIGSMVPVWRAVESRQIHPRVPRQTPITFQAAKELLNNIKSSPDEKRSLEFESTHLTEHDTVFVFDIREDWEAIFAADLAMRVRSREILEIELAPIQKTIEQMRQMLLEGKIGDHSIPEEWTDLGVEFHSRIAELSHPIEGLDRKNFTHDIYLFTKPIYAAAVHNRETFDQVVADHKVILSLIAAGDPPRAKTQMKQHLNSHFQRACITLLREDVSLMLGASPK
jgi:DNA-binding FadR family transcriptional regulator/class 3 adenylate cyclase